MYHTSFEKDSPRDHVIKTLTFGRPERLPRDIWLSPWAWMYQPEAAKYLKERYPSDIAFHELEQPGIYRPSSCMKGEAYQKGIFTDEWGCIFENISAGIHGEVRKPMIDDPADWKQIKQPWEILPDNVEKARDKVNRICGEMDRFVIAPHFPRLWERYQFFRTSEEAYCDLIEGGKEVDRMLKHIHEFYLKEMEFWASTDVDSLFIMDDWGSQISLLISPEMWHDRFMPYYKEYCELAKSSGKFVFMHSDGMIIDIMPSLAKIGVNAINSQIFCMDFDKLRTKVKGNLAFWGEIDRQLIVPSENPEDGRAAVRKVASNLYDPNGGMIIQFEFGPNAKLETAVAIMEEWDAVQEENKTN